MIRFAAVLALLPVAAGAAETSDSGGAAAASDLEADAIMVHVPVVRHQFPVEITDRIRAALVEKAASTPPSDADAESPRPKGH